MPALIKNKIKLFADDLKLIGNAANHSSVAKDIEELEVWESIWLLQFNPAKCKVVHINFNNNPFFYYEVNGIELIYTGKRFGGYYPWFPALESKHVFLRKIV